MRNVKQWALCLILTGCTFAEKQTAPEQKPQEKMERLVLKEGNELAEWTITADLLTKTAKEKNVYSISRPVVNWKDWGQLTGNKGIISEKELKIEECILIRNDKKISSKEIIFKKQENKLYLPFFHLESHRMKLNGKSSIINLSNKKLIFKQGQGKYVY